jgi:hypothetical protein
MQTQLEESIEVNIENLMKLASINEACRDSEYRNKFLKIINGKRFVWNWGAFIFPVQWMIYRKMYLPGFLLSISSVFITTVVGTYVPPLMTPSIWAFIMVIMAIALYLAWFLSGAFGSYIYYRNLQTKVRRGYHKVSTIKNVDKFSVWISLLGLPIGLYVKFTGGIDIRELSVGNLLWWLLPQLAFINCAIVSIMDRNKASGSKNHLIG